MSASAVCYSLMLSPTRPAHMDWCIWLATPWKTTITQHCYDSNRYDIASMDIERTFDAGIDGTGRSFGHMMALDVRVGVKQAMDGSVFGDDCFFWKVSVVQELVSVLVKIEKRCELCVYVSGQDGECGDELFDWRLWVRRVWSVETLVPCEECCHGQELELSSLVVREVMSQTEVWIGYLVVREIMSQIEVWTGFFGEIMVIWSGYEGSLNGEELGFATSVR